MQKINYGFVIVDKDNIPRHDFSVSHDPDYAKQVADTCNISANTIPDPRAPYRAVELFWEDSVA